MTIALRSDASRAVVVLDGVDRVAFNEDGSLELLTPAANPTGNKVMTVSQMPFNKEYVSPEQAISAAGLLTLSHGLGVVPKQCTGELVCKTAEFGYSIGQVINCNLTLTSTSALDNKGISMAKDATNLTGRFGSNVSAFGAHNFTTGAGVDLTNANWRLIVRAWA